MNRLAKIFELHREGINLPRAAVATGILLIPFICWRRSDTRSTG
jgi:hypothetical protein